MIAINILVYILIMLFILFSYLVGSLCSAIIVSYIFSLPDPRKNGSQNPGATNVLRLAGKQYGALVLVADFCKGLLPVLLAKALGAPPIVLGIIGLSAVIGHIYPVFFNFKGGKGVATAFGILFGLHFILGILVVLTWMIIVYLSHYVSLGSLIAIIIAPWYSVIIFKSFIIFLILLFIAILVGYQHRSNISRLINNTEPKLQFSKIYKKK